MTTFKENALRIIAVIGLIAILLLGAWGIIQLAFIIPSFFSSVGNKTTTTESLSLSMPATVASGDTIPLSWMHKGASATNQYSYSISYACADGQTTIVALKAPLPTGAYQAVGCNTPFNYTNATNASKLIATVAGTKSASLNLTVTATKLSSGAVTASAAGSLMVTPAKTAVTTTKTTTKTSSGSTYVAAKRTTQLYGYPDLAVSIASNLGRVTSGSRVALQFVVQNIGTNVAPAGWSFSALLPYNPVYTFTSDAQQALYPGDKIVYTLGYDAQFSGPQYTQNGGCDGWSYPCNPGTPVYGGPGTCNSYGPCTIPGYAQNIYGYQNTGYNTQSVSVQVDPYNLVWEQNEANNAAGISYSIY